MHILRQKAKNSKDVLLCRGMIVVGKGHNSPPATTCLYSYMYVASIQLGPTEEHFTLAISI